MTTTTTTNFEWDAFVVHLASHLLGPPTTTTTTMEYYWRSSSSNNDNNSFVDAIFDCQNATILLGIFHASIYTQTNFTQQSLLAHFDHAIDVLSTPASVLAESVARALFNGRISASDDNNKVVLLLEYQELQTLRLPLQLFDASSVSSSGTDNPSSTQTPVPAPLDRMMVLQHRQQKQKQPSNTATQTQTRDEWCVAMLQRIRPQQPTSSTTTTTSTTATTATTTTTTTDTTDSTITATANATTTNTTTQPPKKKPRPIKTHGYSKIKRKKKSKGLQFA